MVGQEAIIETLRNQVTYGRIAHAYLFCGSRGTGKTSTAKILAKAINCLSPVHGDPCGECDNCRRAEEDGTLDIIEIDAASNNGVDEIRDLRDTVKYPPQYGNYKVYIIDEVHMLSTSAFNALLKTLEEPPAYIVFILATTEPQKLPATILSRCQRFDFGRIPAGQIMSRLKEAADHAGVETTPEALMIIARAAEGGMRDALSILDMCIGYGERIDERLVRNVLGTSDKSFLFRFSKALAGRQINELFCMIDEIMRGGREPAVFVKDVSSHIRALLLAKCSGTQMSSIMDITDEDACEYIRESENFTTSRLMSILDLFMGLETDLRYASSPRIALENTSVKCCMLSEEKDYLALTERVGSLERKIEELTEKLASGEIVRSEAPKIQKKAAPARNTDGELRDKPAILTPTGRNAEEIWKAAVDILKRREPSIAGMMLQGQYGGSDGTLYKWKANMGASFITISLNSPERKKKIEEALTEAAGTECRFLAYDQEDAKQKAEAESEESYVNTLYETFGKEPVDIVEEI